MSVRKTCAHQTLRLFSSGRIAVIPIAVVSGFVAGTARVIRSDQGGYIFYARASLAGVSCRRRWPRLLLLS